MLDAGAHNKGGGQEAMKIYFLLMLISVFVGLSYMPLRTEAKQKVAVRPDSLPA
ncbi:MAG TPA: hypothetical protein VE396_00100 [Xanthobacteraceae bacterium]|nr:hypothetical protein [Xanthobacteraceae bacterium]